MHAPAPPAQHVLKLSPLADADGQLALSEPPLAPPAATSLSVGRMSGNVLVGRQQALSGTLTLASGAAGSWVGGRAHGAASTGLGGQLVLLQVARRGAWITIAHARTGRGGRFRLRYRLHRIGTARARLRFDGDGHEQPSHRRLGHVNVFRVVGASWYGGGGRLACGGTLTSATMGVANKTLRCGTLVTLRYDGRSIRVPVIDRGPYVAGREFDLTEAAKRALGFGGAGELWSTS